MAYFNRKFFSVRKSLILFLYVIFVLSCKTTSFLKNLALIKHFHSEKIIRFILFAGVSAICALKDIVIFPVEKEYISRQTLRVHKKIENALSRGTTENEIVELLAEKDIITEISDKRIRYAKKYLEYVVKSLIISVLLFKISYEVLFITGLFIGGDIFIKRKVQKIEEEKEKRFIAYSSEEDRIYSRVSALNIYYRDTGRKCLNRRKAVEIDNINNYYSYSRDITLISVRISVLIITGVVVFHLYAILCAVFLHWNSYDLSSFLIVYKKIEKLSVYFKKLF